MAQGSSPLVLVDELPSDEEDDSPIDLGLAGLVLLAQYHGVAADASQLKHEYGQGNEPFDATGLLLAAKRLGLKAKISAVPVHRLDKVSLPAMAFQPDGQHFIVAKANDQQILIQDLKLQRPQVLSREQFSERFSGQLLLVASRASVLGELAKFDFRWFVPAVVKYRRILLEVFVVSLFIQLFALVTPLFFQVVMDKVLVHQSLTTLEVIAIGLVAIAVFDVTLNGLRTYVFSHTTSKIDVELGARLFRHIC